MRHPGTDQDVGDPALVGRGSLVAAEAPLVPEQLGPGQAAFLQLLSQRALRDANTVPSEQHLSDMGGRADRLFEPELHRLLDQGGGTPGATLVGTRPVTQPGQPVLPVGPDPAIERVPADRTRLALRADVLLVGDATDDLAALPASEPPVQRLRGQVIAPQSQLLGGVMGHSAPPAWTSPTSKTWPSPPPRASSCWSPAAGHR